MSMRLIFNCFRNGQEGWLSVDNSETEYIKSPGKLKQLNAHTGLYIGELLDALCF